MGGMSAARGPFSFDWPDKRPDRPAEMWVNSAARGRAVLPGCFEPFTAHGLVEFFDTVDRRMSKSIPQPLSGMAQKPNSLPERPSPRQFTHTKRA